MELVLVRHGESEWNRLNLFTGWQDVDLSDAGRQEARNCGGLLLQSGFDFDVCYTSVLKRAIHTLNLILAEMDREWLPVAKSWLLNERHYGALQGLNKAETAAKYGEEQVQTWRRSYEVPPPALDLDDPRNPEFLAQYRDVDKNLLPLAESLALTVDRVIPYYENVIRQDLEAGKRVLIVAHGNSLRALVKYLDHISDRDIAGLNIPTGLPLVYGLDKNLRAVSHRYLGDPAEARRRAERVAAQGRAT